MLTNWSRMQLNELKASDYYHLHECYHNLVTATTILLCVLVQGQARGYGHITHFLPLPTWGHDFPWAIVTQPMGIFQTQGCHMKDMAKTPFALLLVEWVGQSELSKSSTF